ncbi:MAG TPA: hypothetical protein VIL46_03505, partial [Gemmataceae bacterium]
MLLAACAAAAGLALAAAAQQPGPADQSQHPEPAVPPESRAARGPELSPAERVRLDADLPWFRSVEDEAPLRGEAENPGEYQAYNYVLAFADRLDPALMAGHSLKGVPYGNLVEPVRQDYQFKLIRVEGWLRRLESIGPTKQLERADKIPTLYEGWIFPKEVFHPVAAVFTRLPEGIEPGRGPGREVNHYVAFDGYFFKVLHYKTGEHLGQGKYRWRKAPLLLGKMPIPLPPPPSGPVLSPELGLTLL